RLLPFRSWTTTGVASAGSLRNYRWTMFASCVTGATRSATSTASPSAPCRKATGFARPACRRGTSPSPSSTTPSRRRPSTLMQTSL
ncbi:unnamed protein product, partial [Ectocarpus fasciculatus]